MPTHPTNNDDIINTRDIIEALEDGPAPELVTFAKECEDYCEDYEYGATLIRDSHFREYAMELAEENIGAIPKEYTWPISCIDWGQAVRELQHDYYPVDFNGVTYWTR